VIAVTTASVTDRNGALTAFDRYTGNLQHIGSMLVNGGYSGKAFSENVKQKAGCKRTDRQMKPISPSYLNLGEAHQRSPGAAHSPKRSRKHVIAHPPVSRLWSASSISPEAHAIWM